jgi:hypothetical protein
MQLLIDTGPWADGPSMGDSQAGVARGRETRQGGTPPEKGSLCRGQRPSQRDTVQVHPPLHGPVNRWFENGVIREQLSFRDGQRHGPWATWHPNGFMAVDGEFNQGRPHRMLLCFWPNGALRMTGHFWLGVPVGEWRAWSQSGPLLHRGCFAAEVYLEQIPSVVVDALRIRGPEARVA